MGANAQTSVPLFVANSVLTAAQQNISAATGVPVFATTVTRDAAFGGSNKVLAEGQLCYLESTDVVQYYTGAAWASVGATDWAAWTPSWQNLTVGNATQTARYSQSGKTVFFWLKLVLGSTSSVGTQPTFTWPTALPASTDAAQSALTKVVYLDASAQIVLGATDPRASTTALTKLNATTGTVQLQDQDRAVNSTTPFTWTTSDTIWVMGSYEGA